jgi:hypothetical protein
MLRTAPVSLTFVVGSIMSPSPRPILSAVLFESDRGKSHAMGSMSTVLRFDGPFREYRGDGWLIFRIFEVVAAEKPDGSDASIRGH